MGKANKQASLGVVGGVGLGTLGSGTTQLSGTPRGGTTYTQSLVVFGKWTDYGGTSSLLIV